MSRKEKQDGAAGRVVKAKEKNVEHGEGKIHAMGAKEKNERHERILFISLTMEGNSEFTHTLYALHVHAQISEHVTAHLCNECQKTESSGKADNQTYKQSAREVVANEVKSHFPWLPPSKYNLSKKRTHFELLCSVAKLVTTHTHTLTQGL